MQSAAANRYARALVDVVARPELNLDPSAILAELRSVEELINSSSDLRNVLSSPAVAPSKKRAVMRRLLEPMGLNAKTRNFVYVVIDHRRAGEFALIVEAVEQALDEHLGLVAADIRSAAELSEAQKSRLEAQVTRLAGRQAKLKFSTDPALIAGVVAHIGSTVYDGSIRGQLDRLRTRLGTS